MREKRKINLFIISIIILAAMVRFWEYAGFSFSNDELSALFRTQFDSFKELVSNGFFVDGHPGGIQTFLFYWVKAGWITEAWVRLPFVLAGIASVWLIYRIASQWFNKVSALFAAACMALLQFPVLYSQIARPYISGVFFILAMTYFWTLIVLNPENRKYKKEIWIYLGFIISGSAAVYNHYFSMLLAGLIGATGLFLVTRNKFLPYLLSLIAVIILFIPHVPITINHLTIGGVGLWLGKPGWFWPAEHIFFILNESFLVSVLVVFVIVTALFLNTKKIPFSKFHLVSIIWFVVPLIVGFVYSHAVNPVLQHSVLIFSFPFLVMILFGFVDEGFGKAKKLLLIILVAGLTSSLVVEKKYYKTQHFGEFKDIALKVAQWNEQYGEENMTRAININHPWYIDYYLARNKTKSGFEQYENKGGLDLLDLKNVVEQSGTPYFVYAWTKPSPPVIDDIIRYYYPCVVARNNYSNFSEVTLYAKNDSSGCLGDILPLHTYSTDFVTPGKWRFNELLIDTGYYFSSGQCIKIDTSVSYGPVLELLAQDISEKLPRFIRVSLMALAFEPQFKSHLVLSVDSKQGDNKSWVATNLEYFLNTGEWGPVFLRYVLPADLQPNDHIKVYIWNSQNLEFYVDDIKVEFYDQAY